MYRHYKGNSGQSRRVEEREHRPGVFQGKTLAPLPEMKEKEGSPKQNTPQSSPPSPPLGLSGDFEKLFGKLGKLRLETEDLLLIAVLYLMYRESGDKELLIMIGALLFL